MVTYAKDDTIPSHLKSYRADAIPEPFLPEFAVGVIDLFANTSRDGYGRIFRGTCVLRRGATYRGD